MTKPPIGIALLAANASTCNFKHGCAIFKRNELIAIGYNKDKYDKRLKAYGYKKCLLHAEAAALFRAKEKKGMQTLEGCDLIVIRAGKTKLCTSKPCENCMAMIKEAKIRKIHYSNREGQVETMRMN